MTNKPHFRAKSSSKYPTHSFSILKLSNPWINVLNYTMFDNRWFLRLWNCETVGRGVHVVMPTLPNNFQFSNMSINVSELHKSRRSTNFEVLKLWNAQSGAHLPFILIFKKKYRKQIPFESSLTLVYQPAEFSQILNLQTRRSINFMNFKWFRNVVQRILRY